MSKYDVIIVGSGIGGLVCANYLAKSGLKVLVIEKNNEPGGYCTSFKRRGFIIDTTIHAIQNCQSGNILSNVFKELGIYQKIELLRADPTDTIVTENHWIHICNNPEQTIDNFISAYPKNEKMIRSFFDVLNKMDFVTIYIRYRNTNFEDCLNYYFSNNEELKSIFAFFLGNIGSVPRQTATVTAFALLRQFILFGGYYPKGGMQQIPDALVEKLKENNGRIQLKKRVVDIKYESNRIKGVTTDDGVFWEAPIVVSNSDVSHTVEKLLKLDLETTSMRKLINFEPTSSIFIVYVLLRKRYTKDLSSGPGIWCVPSEESFNRSIRSDAGAVFIQNGLFCSIASKLDINLVPNNKDLIRIMTNASYRQQAFWTRNGGDFSNRFLNLISKIIPDIKENIECVGRATPITMKNYTLNRNGSMCGLLNSLEQQKDPITQYLPVIQGLYFTGHWITEKYGNGGVAMAADSGRKISHEILNKNIF